MPLNTNIAMGVRPFELQGPMDQATKALTLQDLIARQQQHQMQVEEAKQLKGILQQTGGDYEKAIRALVASGTPQGIKLAGTLAEAMKDLRPKAQDPFTLSPSQVRYGADGKVLAQAPAAPEKPEASPEIVRLLKMAEGLPPGSPMRVAIERRIQVMNKDPSTVIHMPRAAEPPVAVQKLDGTGNEFVDRKAALGRAPAVKETADRVIPANIAKAYTENATALRKIDSALSEVEKYPAAFGLQNMVGDAVMQRANPKGVTARAIVADIGSLKIHDRSGAAVTAAETPRLLPFIPNANDKPDTIKKKLALFRKEYADIQNDIGSMYSAEQGYRALPSAQTRASDASGADPLGIRK